LALVLVLLSTAEAGVASLLRFAPRQPAQTEKGPALPTGMPAAKVFSQPPESSLAPSSLSHTAKSRGGHVCLSYRFSDGMIHDSLVPRYIRGVAPEGETPRSPISCRNPMCLGSSLAPERSVPC